MDKEKLNKSILLRYEDELDKEIDKVLNNYSPPIPSKSAIMRAAIKLGLERIKNHQKLLRGE